MNSNTETLGSIRRLLAVGGLAVAGAVALTGCGILEEAASDDTATDEVNSEQFDAVADAAAGDCLPEPPVGGATDTFAIECDSAEAFWTLTAIEADPGITAEADGTIADPTPIYELCGDEVGANIPGASWTDWNMVYDQTSGNVDYLFCLEALGNPTVDGATPVYPSAEGECFASTDYMIGTYPCDSATVDSELIDTVEVDPASWLGADADAESIAMSECSGDWSYYLPAIDQFGRTATIYCTN
ncbi:hypothetical protein [Glycomyces harbinensis]|uniref:Septum formation n=1 Tax=Glycomyces harbinensis TaxID=58114 RepID=A0A1G6Z2Z0_9ACTN|nr:hypothetical protein [Glycomyces harbinensis]SDD96862.1 hypothetical protein SAMN05216270_11019 [Glycomyces harbinensis]